eukprot:TRINITY_DN11964_c0_g1_i1.p1 TRINITY_DN11964_c0_g1~~TRINITY_DN11964_c0_g1_i1.p1  ORF type:complete len:1917 (-),score=354.76 TRINITY_DN11964_c0_g1_i1:196-5946(-)
MTLENTAPIGFYGSGGPIPASQSLPASLPDALEDVVSRRPSCGITLCGGGGKCVRFRYGVILDAAKRVARRLREEVLRDVEEGDSKPIVLLPVDRAALPEDTTSFGLAQAAQLCAFWGCLFAGVKAVVVEADEEDCPERIRSAWELCTQPPVFVSSDAQSDAMTRTLPGAKVLSLQRWLAAEDEEEAEAGREVALAKACRSRSMHVEAFGLCTAVETVYWYTQSGVVAAARSEEAALASGKEEAAGLVALRWQPLATPQAALAHCCSVLCGRDEVYADTRGEPVSTLRLACRHGATSIAAPAVFFRRLLAEVSGGRRNVAAEAIQCIRRWTVQTLTTDDSAGYAHSRLAEEDVASFVRLCHRAAVVKRALIAAWGACIALGDCRGESSAPSLYAAAPGIEVAVVEDGLRVRGMPAVPGLHRWPKPTFIERSWVPIGLRCMLRKMLPEATVSKSVGSGFNTVALADRMGSSQAGCIQVAGVEYAAGEIEAAVEAAAGVLLGSAAAVLVPATEVTPSSPTVEAAERGLGIVFAAADATLSSRHALVTAVRSHLTLTLGIHPKFVLPLPSCKLPRTAAGEPCLHSVVKGFTEGNYAAMSEEVSRPPEDSLKSEWVFEEDFVPCSLTSSSTGLPGEADGDDGDSDDLEERFQGVVATEAVDDERGEDNNAATTDAAESESAGPVTGPRVLVVLDSGDIGRHVVRLLRIAKQADTQDDSGPPPQPAVVATRDFSRACEEAGSEEVVAVVDCSLCEPLPSNCDGGVQAGDFLRLLKAWEQSKSCQTTSRRLLCASVGRHPRVCAERSDPRLALQLGTLLAAAEELPWLSATQLDASPSLGAEDVAAAIVAELGAGEAERVREVLVDGERQRLVRRLRPLALVPGRQVDMPDRWRAALLAGGAGGIGTLFAQSLNARHLLLMGRSPPSAPRVREALRQFAGRDARNVTYLQADIAAAPQQLKSVLQLCPVSRQLDFAANLSENFTAPSSLRDLPENALDGPAQKLQGGSHLLAVLADIRKGTGGSKAKALPVLLTSSAVGLRGAARLLPYTAGARAIEALCAKSRVLALEAVFGRFTDPRFGMLAAGVDASHARFAKLIADRGAASAGKSAAEMTANLPGCIELLNGAVKKVLGHEVKLGDSLVEAGLDSMTSLSLHSALVSASGGMELSTNIFYDMPTVLELATFINKKAKSEAGEEEVDSTDNTDSMDPVEAMLEDADARRSYHFGLARDAVKRGDLQEAVNRCQKAASGAQGAPLASVLALKAEALQLLNDDRDAVDLAHSAALEARRALVGQWHPDTAIAAARCCLWQDTQTNGTTNGNRQHVTGGAELRNQINTSRGEFFRRMAWPTNEEPLDASVQLAQLFPATPSSPSGGRVDVTQMKNLHLDGLALEELPASIGMLIGLESLRLRRNKLKRIPPEISALKALRELLLTGNDLTDLPIEVGSMSKLQFLGVEGNLLSRIPEAVYKLQRLLQLSLDEQRCPLVGVDERPLPAGVLTVLRARNCGAKAFVDLLPSTQGPPNLNTVFWAHNGLTAAPAGLPRFAKSMRLLDLAHNAIAALGTEVFDLVNLRDLSLCGNRLRELPREVCKMKNLQQLWLHGNYLETLPEELGDLTSLAILELHHNRLESLPLRALAKLTKLNWLFAHGNALTEGAKLIEVLSKLPRLKVVGLGANRLQLAGVKIRGLRASFGLGWNEGIAEEDLVLTESLTTSDLHWDPMKPGELQDVLVVTFSSQGAPVAMGQAEVRGLRDMLIGVDALYVCDPANAWFLQDPSFTWSGLAYYGKKIGDITKQYKRVFMWGGSMGGSAALLFSHLADCVHAFSPQVDLQITWPTFASPSVMEGFRSQVQASLQACRGISTVHVGEENHTDCRHASLLPASVRVHYHDTANHNTMKHVKNRDKLLALLKFEVVRLLVGDP